MGLDEKYFAPSRNLLYRMGQKKNKEFKELKEFKKDVSIKINKVMTIAIGDIYDDLGTDPDKKVLSTQEVQSILMDIEDLLIKELESI